MIIQLISTLTSTDTLINVDRYIYIDSRVGAGLLSTVIRLILNNILSPLSGQFELGLKARYFCNESGQD